MNFDFLIVGSGLFGAVFAYLAKKSGNRVLVIEKRQSRGGNIYCDSIEGINVHKYGAHIFHTSDKAIWDFVNSFVPFNRYTNCPIANYKGRLFNLPFNMNTFYALWGITNPLEAQKMIEKQRNESGIINPSNLEEQAIFLVGRDIYEILIKEYTEKQWGRACKELPPFIIKRLPVRFTFDNNYFNDVFQGIPIGGYNRLIDSLLDGVEVRLDTDFFRNKEYWLSIAHNTIFTGKIDQFFDYKYGQLEYRTVNFETNVQKLVNFQGNAVVNYTSSDVPYTRIIEHKHFEPDSISYMNKSTVISREFSSEWTANAEPFYPVNDARNSAILERYQNEAKSTTNVYFGGRLGEYKYYDMDDVIISSINLWKKFSQNN